MIWKENLFARQPEQKSDGRSDEELLSVDNPNREQPEHEEVRHIEAMFRQRGDYWRGEAERFRAVLEWLEQNNPAALELCPFKAPTSHAAGAGTPGVPTASGAGALTPPGSGSVTEHEEARRMAELREEAESNSKLECVGLAPGRFASWALILELLALLSKAEQERDAWKERYEMLGGEARKVNRAWRDERDRADDAERELEDALEAGRALEEQRNVAVREVGRLQEVLQLWHEAYRPYREDMVRLALDATAAALSADTQREP